MKLNPGQAAEYKKRHDEIWPELSEKLTEAGVYDYSIYLDEETNILFGVRKVTDDNTAGELHKDPIVRKWWTSWPTSWKPTPTILRSPPTSKKSSIWIETTHWFRIVISHSAECKEMRSNGAKSPVYIKKMRSRLWLA